MSVGPRRDRTGSERVVEWKRQPVPAVLVSVDGGTTVQDTALVPDTVTRLGSTAIPDLGLTLAWARKALGVEAGVNLGLAREMRRVDPLGTLRLTYDVNERLSAIGALTSRAGVAVRDLPAAQMVTVGIRIRGGQGHRERVGTFVAKATEFRAARDTADCLTITIRAQHAERVEIAADFTRWAPLNLERLAGGWWRARVQTPPGTHRVSVRVDGGRWNAPPGLPPLHDEFGATVGLLVIQ
jgi:hypothetical protein